MKNQIKLIAIILVTIFIFYSCEKDSATNPSVNPKKQSTLTDFFKNLAPTMQNFTVTAGQFQVIQGEKGTKITFFANSFKKKDGTILTSGNVKIVLQEMLTGPEMILARKTTTSDGKLLQSGGQIYVNAYLNGEELVVNQDAKPNVQIPTGINAPPMDLYIGSVKANDSIIGDSTINWTNTNDTVFINKDTIASGTSVNYYYYNMSDFGFNNCDVLYHSPGIKTDIKVIVPEGYVDTNCNIFYYFPSINGVVSTYYTKLTNEFKLGYNLAPVGIDLKIVLVAKKDNKFYYEIKTMTVSDGMVAIMTNPIEASESSIKLAIKSM